MKFIIKEDRLRSIIFKFINSQINIIDGEDGLYGDSNSKYYVLFFNKRYNTLFVSFEMIHMIQGLFSLDYRDSKTVISRWFEQKTGEISREVIGKPETSIQFSK